ncbi:AcrR family transcriptional regulator [Nocardioides thalensis]|uniref:AcrR family transcriptional regulator n=1 Tax=Nocardioides thalensis TaxID=1914755 RepID=A0A853C7P0_9ACTN|nr:TetR/AcrR family transcriptional regulator [Nocardioides thalensis]NYJ02682.1 AcrR family transcriptional regulator [Nocardioides thalensis]
MAVDEHTAREVVVRAADELFYARGVQAVGMDAVRTASGLPLKRIYGLFASKDELVLAVLAYRRSLWETGLAAATERAADPRGRVLAVFDFLDEWFREPDFRGCGFVNIYGELGACSGEVADAVRRQKEHFQDHVRRMVEEAGLPAYVAPQVALLAEGAQTTAAISGSPEAARQARAAAETLLDAAGTS